MKTINYSLRDVGSLLNLAEYFQSAVGADYKFINSDVPDYLLCSCFGNSGLEPDTVRIEYIGENVQPDFNVFDYAIGFHYIDFEDRYLRYPLYAFERRAAFDVALKKHMFKPSELSEKTLFCSFVVSNGADEDIRTKFFRELCKYKKVSSGGRYENNIGEFLEGWDGKRRFQQKCKFAIAFENSCTNGYTTEKLIEAWQAGAIPIYWGNPVIGKEFNTKAFINCHDYSSFDEVIQRIKEIDSNDELYISIMREPILFSGCEAEKYVTQDYFKDFLIHIFEQDKQKAYRRSSYYNHMGKLHEQWTRKSLVKGRRERVIDFFLGKGN